MDYDDSLLKIMLRQIEELCKEKSYTTEVISGMHPRGDLDILVFDPSGLNYTYGTLCDGFAEVGPYSENVDIFMYSDPAFYSKVMESASTTFLEATERQKARFRELNR